MLLTWSRYLVYLCPTGACTPHLPTLLLQVEACDELFHYIHPDSNDNQKTGIMDTSPRKAKNLSEVRDILGRLAHTIYTPLCFCFPLLEDVSHSQIIDKLTEGIEALSIAFPWLTAQVVIGDIATDTNVNPKIIPLEKTCRLHVQDLTLDPSVPSMGALKKARFPSRMLDGTLLTPLTGLPSSYGESGEYPVFFIQVNFIKGGLLLNFAGEHSIMDGQGFGEIIRMFSKACHGKLFTEEELLQGNRARDNVISLLDLDNYKPGPEMEHLLIKPKATSTPDPGTTEPLVCTWQYFHFSPTKLSKLKNVASPSSSSTEPFATPYITTNDAVSAFVWKSVSKIRSTRLDPQTKSTFARAVDVRPALSIPPTYLGNMSNHTYTTIPLSSITSGSLSSLASTLRLALKPSELSYAMRSLATQLTLTPNETTVASGADLDFSGDIFFSSWARFPCYTLDFNLGLGFPESVRRPRFDALEGLMYLLPMDRQGGIDAAICLRDEDLEGLRSDKEFGEFAEWIG